MIKERAAVQVYNGEDETFTVLKCLAGEQQHMYNVITEDAYGNVIINTVKFIDLVDLIGSKDVNYVIEILNRKL